MKREKDAVPTRCKVVRLTRDKNAHLAPALAACLLKAYGGSTLHAPEPLTHWAFSGRDD